VLSDEEITKVLTSEADWLEEASNNALALGNLLSMEHAAIEKMIGWVRLHAKNPKLVTKRKVFTDAL
jgi:hypothetical protein